MTPPRAGSDKLSLAGIDRAKASPVDRLDELQAQRYQQTTKLQHDYGKWALIMMACQLWISDVVFSFYGFANGWKIEPIVINTWLGATVVQVIGVVVIITRYLFPSDTRS